MSSNFAYLFTGISFGVFPLCILIYFNRKIFIKYLSIIIKINLILLVPTIITNEIGYSMGFYEVPAGKIIGLRILHVPFEDILFAIILGIIVPLVTIIMVEAHKKGLRFRYYFLKTK